MASNTRSRRQKSAPAPVIDTIQSTDDQTESITHKPLTRSGKRKKDVKESNRDVMKPRRKITEPKRRKNSKESKTNSNVSCSADSDKQPIDSKPATSKSKSSTLEPNTSLDIPQSYRLTDNSLWGMKCQQSKKGFSLERMCQTFCYHEGLFWVPCPVDNVIDVYNSRGILQSTLQCTDVWGPTSLHPFTPGNFLLGAYDGLYLYNTAEQSVSTRMLEGDIRSVHASGSYIVALEAKIEPGYMIHVFNTRTNPPLQVLIFSLNHTNATRVLIHDNDIYVSMFWNYTSATKYTLQGALVAQWGRKGKLALGEMSTPFLCGVDTRGNILVADAYNFRLQCVSQEGDFCGVAGVGVSHPWDAVIEDREFYVLNDKCKHIQSFKIK